MLVNAQGRRWPTAGRFGLFGAIVNRLREVFWGVERDDLEMILFTLHPFRVLGGGVLPALRGSRTQRAHAERVH